MDNLVLMDRYHVEQFQKDMDYLGVSLSRGQICQFLRYYEMLVEWNQRMNLTAITEYEEVMKKHFVDSLSLVKIEELRIKDQNPQEVSGKNKLTLIDVGTGAGFPGLVLKIAFPWLQVTLLDSLNKRIQFLNAVIEQLKLSDVQAIHGRAEDFAKQGKLREKFDLCVSRAVANLSTLSEYCLPFVKVGGGFISYKSETVEEELKGAKDAIQLLGGNVKKKIEFSLPETDISRSLIWIEKEKPTPKKFPRKAGLPAKEPIQIIQ